MKNVLVNNIFGGRYEVGRCRKFLCHKPRLLLDRHVKLTVREPHAARRGFPGSPQDLVITRSSIIKDLRNFGTSYNFWSSFSVNFCSYIFKDWQRSGYTNLEPISMDRESLWVWQAPTVHRHFRFRLFYTYFYYFTQNRQWCHYSYSF